MSGFSFGFVKKTIMLTFFFAGILCLITGVSAEAEESNEYLDNLTLNSMSHNKIGSAVIVNGTIDTVVSRNKIQADMIKESRSELPISPLTVSPLNPASPGLQINTLIQPSNGTAASLGFTFDPCLQGLYTNSTTPLVNAHFVNVEISMIRMFIDNSNVTGSCTVTGTSMSGNITYHGTLPDGNHTVIVNGISSLTGQWVSATETFVKDTQSPFVIINSIIDSDGDGYPEAGELLIIDYTVTDANPYLVGIGTAWNTSAPNGTLFFSPDTGNVIGNLNRSVTAIDRVLSTNRSDYFHVYNNYLAYIHNPPSQTEICLENTSTYDIFTHANAITIYGAPSNLTYPTTGILRKTMADEPGITFDNRKTNPINTTTLPTALDVYPTPSGTLDFSIQVPNVTKATMFIVKVNNTLLNQLIQDPSRNSVDPATLEEILSQHPYVLYGHSSGTYGNALIDETDPHNVIFRYQKGSISYHLWDPNHLTQTINANGINISDGFNTSSAPGLAPLPVKILDKGEYAILAMCIDNDRLGIIATKPFVITERANVLATTASTYEIGNPVVINSTFPGTVISGLIVKESPVYSGNIELNFTQLGTSSIHNLTLNTGGNTQVKKLTSDIWISKRYGSYNKTNNSNTVTIPTTGLLPGIYRVYMLLENGGNITSLDQTTVALQENSDLKPDLVAEIVSAPVLVRKSADGSIHFNTTFAIRNAGNADIMTPFQVQFKISGKSSNLTIDDDIPINTSLTMKIRINMYPNMTETDTVSRLEETTRSFTLIMTGNTSIGSHEISLDSDVNNDIEEFNETNNYVSTTISVLPFSDPVNTRLILPNTSLYQNTPTKIPIRVANITNGTGLSFNLTYDSSVIRVNSITLNQSYAPGSSLTVNSTLGLVRLSFSRTEGINIEKPTEFLILDITGTGAVGTSTQLFANDARWSTSDFEIQQFNVVNGKVLVYRVRGDFNGNGYVDVGDVARVAYMVVGLTPVDMAADFNNVGSVDIGDAAKIAYFSVGKIPEL